MHKNPLVDKGIISQSGEVNKNKINLIAGAITLPFAETVWVTTNGDRDTVNRMTEVFVSMNTPTDRGKLFRIIQMLYGLVGLQFSDEAAYIPTHKAALEYFIYSFILDFGEIIKDFIAEERGASA